MEYKDYFKMDFFILFKSLFHYRGKNDILVTEFYWEVKEVKVTIKDVARDAGVSPSTVSRVISNSSRIGVATKERVRESIKKLGYTPNILARSLVSKRTKIIGVVMPHEADTLFSNPFFIQAMKGISVAAEKNHYHIMYAFGRDEKSELEAVENYISRNIVDGICLLTARKGDKCINYLKDKGFPFVVIGTPEEKNLENILWVDNDNEEAVRNIVRTLSEKGHQRVGFIGAKKNWTVSINREKGFIEESRLRKIEPFIVYEKDFTRASGYRGARELFKQPGITSIICTDDILAFGAQKYLLENDSSHVEILGFNRIDPQGNFGPEFSSVDINSAGLGEEAINLLISKLNHTNKTNHKIVDTKLEKVEEEL